MKHTDAITERLARPSVEGLVYALRHPEVWPNGFEWDYRDCQTCAMGLAWKLWDEIIYPAAAVLGAKFRMSDDDAERIFIGLRFEVFGRDSGKKMSDITPEHVADALDAYLAARGR